ncbi:MAG: DUF4350 domain-containing protein [Paenibacillaceae bacterium]
MPRLNKLHFGLVLTIICFLLIGYWIVKPDLERYPAYLSFSPDVDGTKAWRQLLEQRQSQVREWKLTWRDLPQHENQLLVVIEPIGVTDDERAELRSWLTQGNDLILFHHAPIGWDEFSLVEQEEANSNSNSNSVHTIYTGGSIEGEGLSALVVTSNRLADSTEQQDVLFTDSEGILGSRVAVGAGSLTVVLAPDWLTNDAILEHSHFELVWPLFHKRWDAVWIDETHHGYQQKPGLLAVYPAWLVIACIQLSAALLFWLWLRGKRFGPVYTPRAWTVRRGDETLQAVAGWYERLGLRGEALIHQQQLLRQLLYEHWGLSPSASTAQAAALARGRWPEAQVARLVRLLELGPPAQPGGVQSPPGAPVVHPHPQSPVHAKAFMAHTREMSEIIALIEQHKLPK